MASLVLTVPPKRRILVVDDEETILRAISRLLKREHEVVSVSDPTVALARIHAGERFDVVFCDLTMPGMSGDELHRAVQETSPDQAGRFVFMTGGVSDDATRAFLASVPNERLTKPFDAQVLTEAARRVTGRE